MENKLGIISAVELADAEERLGKLGVRNLYDSGRLPVMSVGTFDSLAEIHRAMLGGIYDFAGELRTVDIYKGNVRFVLVEGLQSAVRFAAVMSQDTYDEIINKFAQMNIAHPFREGNGRAMRLWLDLMFWAKFKKLVDWSKIDKKSFDVAMGMSALDSRAVAQIIRPALTDKVDRAMFLRAIDGSFALDGYNKYRAEQL
ncbi:MAG: Fic family protein [Clostridiales bacterium]|nr:Fic family protein [Clostridiales bacterium]